MATYNPPMAENISQQVLDIHEAILDPQWIKKEYVLAQLAPNNFANFLRMHGAEMPISRMNFKAAYSGKPWTTIHNLNPIADPGVNNSVSITLSPQDHINGESFPRLMDVMAFPKATGYVEGLIVAKDSTTNPNAHVISVQPISAGADFGALTAGEELIVVSNAYADGMGHSDGRVSYPVELEFYLGINKEQVKSDLIAGITALKYPRMAENGKEIEGMVDRSWFQAMLSVERQHSYDMMWAQEATNPNLVISAALSALLGGGANNKVTRTKGFMRWADDMGWTDNITLGAEAIADLQAWGDYFISQGIYTRNIWSLLGRSRLANYNQIFKTYTDQGGGMKYVTELLENSNSPDVRAGYAAFFDFNKITLGDFNFLLTSVADFNELTGMNAPGYNASQSGILFPMGRTPNKTGYDELGEIIPNIGHTYFKSYGKNLKYYTYDIDFRKTTGVSKVGKYIESVEGFFGMYFNQCILIP